MEPNEIKPGCGMATCLRDATHADAAGVGFCAKHAHAGAHPISEDWPLDPWWEAAGAAEASSNGAAWDGLEYGEYPPGSGPS